MTNRPVQCLISCLADVADRAGADARPLYFGAWDADLAVTAEGEATNYSADIPHDPAVDRFGRLFGGAIECWYDHESDKMDNFARLERMGADPESELIVQLDLYRLPARGNIERGSHRPHFALARRLPAGDWDVRDVFFEWRGIVTSDAMREAFASNPLGGGYRIERFRLRPPADDDVAFVFESSVLPDANPLLEAAVAWMTHHLGRSDAGRADIVRSLDQLAMAAERKRAYRQAFSFFTGESGSQWEAGCLMSDELLSRWRGLLLHFSRGALTGADAACSLRLRAARPAALEKELKLSLWELYAAWKTTRRLRLRPV